MVYRAEHPKPQFMRENWLNLNGEWQFEIDNSNSGTERMLFENGKELSGVINVPFCPESELSGIENVDFMSAVWYKREFCLTAEQLKFRVVLHFGAVDYEATVYINGKKCGSHRGGYVSFCFDISDFVVEGKNTVTVCAVDDTRSPLVPSGKQSEKYNSQGCYYTRTTGIWQTVWLEFTPKAYIKGVKYITDIDNASVNINATLVGSGVFEAEAFYKGKSVGKAQTVSCGGNASVTIKLSEKHLWEVGNGRLYDLALRFGEDAVNSYFGLRQITLDGHRFLINGKSVFQRLILDQGFYPDGIYTAPSDDALRGDIERSLAMGFNGARLHEKVFEERFLYHCDRLGYIVWGEYANWGLDHSREDSVYAILPEWLEEIERDFNHPSIIGWCPFNETWDQNGRKQYDDLIKLIYLATKAADPTRPCIDTSGNFHILTDVYDLHDYEQNPEELKRHYERLGQSNELDFYGAFKDRQRYDGKLPFFVSEYGGIGWNVNNGWGYGNAPETQQAFIDRLKGLTDVLFDHERIFGFCYTQLTDVEQEKNGLYTYDRKPKFDPEIISKIISRKAAIED